MQLDRRCGSGVQAIATAAMMVQTGAADVVLAGGVESMSNVEYYSTDMRWGSARRHRQAARPAGTRARTLAARVTLRPHQRHDRDRREPGT
jgi:acetyl-CoA acetyltransferase